MTQHNALPCSDFSDYIGIPYADEHCHDPQALNCWQLCEKVMLEIFGIQPLHYEYQGDFSKVGPVFTDALAHWQQVDFEQRLAGDVLLMNVTGYPIHLGILISHNEMLHTLRTTGSSCEDITSAAWCRRILGVYRWNP